MKNIQRIYTVGSEWVYFKIYTGSYIADDILVKEIRQLVGLYRKNRIADCWFFIRYADPDTHVRVRFHLIDTDQIGYVVSTFYQKLNRLVQDRIVHRIQMDTYVREIERYGEAYIAYAEQLFCIDSECVVNLVKNLSNEYSRGLVAFKLTDSVLTAFGLDMKEKRDLVYSCAEGFKNEFGMGKSKVFSREYRNYQNVIRNMIEHNSVPEETEKLLKIVDKYYCSENTAGLIQEMFSKKDSVSKSDFLRSYIHMTLNRLFNCDNRKHEMVVHEYMYRYYKSAIARSGLPI